MRKQILLLVVFLASAFFANAQQDQKKKSKIYFIKSGYVKSIMTGNTVGTSEMWWDDYGQKVCRINKSETTVKVLGFKKKSQSHTLTIENNGTIWRIDYVENTATKTYQPNYNGKPINELDDKERDEMQQEAMDLLGFEKLPNEKFMGYNCEVYKGLGTKVWSYKNVPLKSDGNVLGVEVKSVAEVFKPNSAVPASKFVAPKREYEEIGQPYDVADVTSGQVVSDAIQQQQEEENGDNKSNNSNAKKGVTTYPYEKFTTKCNAFHYDGYRKFLARREPESGGLIAMYRKGFTKMMMVTVIPEESSEYSKMDGEAKGTHNGQEYVYGLEQKDLGKSSFIAYDKKAFNSVIIISITPAKSQEEMLKMMDLLGL